jgi:hypothetical protein
MKKLMLSTLALCLILGTAALAKNPPDTTVSGWVTDPMCGKNGGPSMANADCVKRCSKDGKLVLVTDGDSKVWAVVNSEALKGHEGHHVKVTGHPDADKGTIHVSTVAMLDDQKAPAAKDGMKKHDEMKSDKKADPKKADKKS